MVEVVREQVVVVVVVVQQALQQVLVVVVAGGGQVPGEDALIVQGGSPPQPGTIGASNFDNIRRRCLVALLILSHSRIKNNLALLGTFCEYCVY